MSVPKPRVWQIAPPYLVPANSVLEAYWMPGQWAWVCPCGAGWKGGTHRVTLHAAVQHSRAHTGERIAVELERRSMAAHHAFVWGMLRERFEEAREARGNAEGIEAAALLVRERLVRST